MSKSHTKTKGQHGQLLGVIGVSFAIVEGASLEGSDAERGAQAALQFDYLARPWLGMASALAKVSICLLIRRLVARNSNGNVRVWRVVLAAQIILLLLVNLAYTFTALLRCRPLEKLWKPEVPGSCWGLGIQQSIGYFQGGRSLAFHKEGRREGCGSGIGERKEEEEERKKLISRKVDWFADLNSYGLRL